MTTTDPRPTISLPSPTAGSSDGPDPLSSQKRRDTQAKGAAEGQTSPQSMPDSMPIWGATAGTTTASPANSSATPNACSLEGHKTSHGHTSDASQTTTAVADYSPAAMAAATSRGCAPAGDSSAGQPAGEASPKPGSLLADPLLALAADVLDDLERMKNANANRLRQLTRSVADKDGEVRGFGLDLAHPDVARLAALVDMLAVAEHQAELNLSRILRKHPIGPWMKATTGIGEKQGARLLASIGDPYIRPELVFDNDLVSPARPRMVSELWAYCGYHVVRGRAVQRTRGEKANWSSTAKMRAFLIAESCMKNRNSPYRKVYDDARATYADAVHQVFCVRCGPSGKPAQQGSPLSDGHKHARALRAVAKEVLKDLWREARRIHQSGDCEGVRR